MVKPVVISSLAMRFHESHGWNKELLIEYLKFKPSSSPGFIEKDFPGGDRYWILDFGCQIDVDRLVSDGHVGRLFGRESWGELKNLSDVAVLKERNK